MRKWHEIHQKLLIGKVSCNAAVKTISYITASVLLTIGGLVYICYRPLRLLMFRWAHISQDTHWLMSVRHSIPADLPAWFVYALPDGLWACSYTIIVGTIWNFEISRCLELLILIPMAGVISELLQACGLLPGIFDWSDMTAYIFGMLVGLLFLQCINNKRKHIKHI